MTKSIFCECERCARQRDAIISNLKRAFLEGEKKACNDKEARKLNLYADYFCDAQSIIENYISYFYDINIEVNISLYNIRYCFENKKIAYEYRLEIYSRYPYFYYHNESANMYDFIFLDEIDEALKDTK